MTVLINKPKINLREELSSLKKVTGVKGEEILRSNTIGDVYYSIKPTMFRNKLINGGFDVWQRGTSFTNIGGFGADRWSSSGHVTGSVVSRESFSIGSDVVPGNPKYFHRLTLGGTDSGAADRVVLRQMVEDYSQFIGKRVVLSGWYRSTATLSGANWLFQIKRSSSFYDNCLELTGSPQTPTQGMMANTSGVWKYFEVSAFIPNNALSGQTITSTGSFSVMFYYQQCSNPGTIDLANLQLELDYATPFEQRPYPVELALSQRYFFKHTFGQTQTWGYGHGQTTNLCRITATSPVPMRALPSISSTAILYAVYAGYNGTSVVANSTTMSNLSVIDMTGSNIIIEATASGVQGTLISYGYSGYIQYQAEL